MKNHLRSLCAVGSLLLLFVLGGFLANSNQTPQVFRTKGITLGASVNTPVTVYTAGGYAAFTATIGGLSASNVMNVTAISTGSVTPGQQISGAPSQAIVLQQLTGAAGGTGLYYVSVPMIFASGSLTAGTNGAKWMDCNVSSSDSSAHLVTVLINGNPQTTFSVPINSSNSFSANDCLSPLNWPGLPVDGNGKSYKPLASGDIVTMQFATALGAGTLQSQISAGE